MKLRTAVAKANNLLIYLKTRRKARLYQQWVKRANLPPEAVPEEEFGQNIVPKVDKEQFRLNMLYILLGASLVILCVGLILLIVESC